MEYLLCAQHFLDMVDTAVKKDTLSGTSSRVIELAKHEVLSISKESNASGGL